MVTAPFSLLQANRSNASIRAPHESSDNDEAPCRLLNHQRNFPENNKLHHLSIRNQGQFLKSAL